ncbi:Rib/alpha-like domain-containing protein [Corynebacterium glucuronolyticum]
MGDFYIRFKEKTDVKAMVGDAKQAPTNGTRLGGKFAGRVYWENYLDGHVVSNWGAASSGYYEFDKNKDAPASKIKVYAAYLSDQAIAKINSQETKTALGVKDIRGTGWTAGNERDLQNWIKKQIAKDGADKWLAESYYTETNSDGEFTIQFNGTWGSAWDTTPSVVMSDEAKERLHSVSKTSEDGDWALGLPNSKHVNTEWMFIQTEPIENATVNSPWNFGTYTGNVDAKYGITGFQTQWGVAWGRVSNASNIKIPIMSMDPQLNIVKYDSYENFAAPGDTVATKTTGIALQGKSDQKYQIVWKDAAGNVIKVKDKSGNEQPLESAPLTVGSDGTLPSYPMTVPNDLEKVTTYKAYLYALAPDGSREDAQPLAVDSYTAIPLEKPVYTPKEVEQGKQGVNAAPKFDNLGTKPVETDDNPYPENSHFEIDEANLPEGVSASDVSIDKATGVVTLKKASGEPGSTINIPVKYVVEKALLDENKKPVLRPEYKPGTGDLLPDNQRKPVIAKQVMNTVAPFTITAPTTPAPSVVPGSVVDEVPNDGSGKKLDDKVKNPTDGMSGTVTDKDGNPVKDATVTVDPSTGEITVSVPKGTTPGEGYKVQVKDKDGKNVGDPIDVKVTDASTTPAPSVVPGSVVDEVPNDGSGKKLDDKVKNPTDGMSGTVTDKDGNPVKDATVTVDPSTGEITVTVPKGTTPGEGYKVQVKDKDGKNVGDPIDVKVTDASTTPAPSVVPGSVVDEVPNDGSGKKLDDKVKNPTDGMSGTVTDKDGNPVKDATVTVDPSTGEITVTVPKGTTPGEGYKVQVKDKDGKNVGDPIDVKVTDASTTPAPSVVPGSVVDEVPNDGSGKKLDDKVKNPTDGMSGTVTDKDGNPVKDATVTVDPSTGEITVTVPDGTKPGKYVVEITDKDGNKIGELPITVVDKGTAEGSIPGLTEEQAQVCVGASAASAVPLLLLTPIALGLAMDNQQVKDLTAGFGKQLEDINTGIQKTLGIYNPELAQQFKVQVAPHLQNLVLAAGFVASIALLAGVAATKCVPGGGSSDNTSSQK